MSIDDLHRRVFGPAPACAVQTPGRVNLIGEHIDYNGGHVLPMAIDRCVSIAAAPSPDARDHIHAAVFGETLVLSPGETGPDGWAHYVSATLAMARREGLLSAPVTLAIDSAVPHGAGLSSSAALIVGLLRTCAVLSGRNIPVPDVARLAQRVENEALGVPCGIMDQMAVAGAAPGAAMLLDTVSLDFDLTPLPRTHHFAVVHSGVTRRLNEGRYAERRAECEAAARHLNADYLCRLTAGQVAQIGALPAPLDRRARHAWSEQQRVQLMAGALHACDIETIGRLMTAGHASLRDDFEVSLPAIDRLVDTALTAGAVGARLTGGGFGGCIVACVAKSDLAAWRETVEAHCPGAWWIC